VPDLTVSRPLGDVSGDGVPELLAFDWTTLTWLVLFSPHESPLAIDGLPLGPEAEVGQYIENVRHLDLDGDELEDVVATNAHGEDYGVPALASAGEINIWYGKDLLAAWEDYQAQARRK
jgi:hypothetical protein